MTLPRPSGNIIFVPMRNARYAEVAELADALDSKSSVVTLRAGSSPAFGTTSTNGLFFLEKAVFFYFCIYKLMLKNRTYTHLFFQKDISSYSSNFNNKIKK